MSVRHERGTGVEWEFDLFVRHHARPLLGYCLRRSSHADAHEAAAEAFAIAWRRFEDVPDGDAGLYWLFGVARRVLSNQRRGQIRLQSLTRRVGSLAEAPAPSVETMVVGSTQHQEVMAALQRLQPSDQEILALIVWDEVPRAEASRLLGITEQAAHKRYQRALGRLERALRRVSGYENTTHPLVEEGGAK